LRSNPITARRPLLVNGVLGALQSAPEGRPTPLATWLASLADTLSQTTQPFEPAGPSTSVPSKRSTAGRRVRRGLIAAAAVVVLAAVALVGYAIVNSTRGTATAQTAAGHTQSLPAPPAASPTQAAQVEVAPSSGESASNQPAPSGTAGPGGGSSQEPTIEPGADYFADRSKFDATDDTGHATDPANINGQFYTQNLRFYAYGNSHAYATYVLGRHYSRLKTVVGVDDSAHSNLRVRIEIVADNKTIFRQDMAKGTAATVDLPVSGVYSVTFSVTLLSGDSGYGDFADARVLP
jgi:hypothetical protein